MKLTIVDILQRFRSSLVGYGVGPDGVVLEDGEIDFKLRVSNGGVITETMIHESNVTLKTNKLSPTTEGVTR